MNENCPVCDAFAKADRIVFWNDGRETSLPTGSKEYDAFFESMGKMFADARQMPAFGVSIDSLTRKEKESGLWIEFSFDEEQECFGMPFEGLLFCVKKDYCGFNVVRLYQGKYEGRCFYIDLGGGTMSEAEKFMREFLN